MVAIVVAGVMVLEDDDTCDPSTCSIALLLCIYKSSRLKGKEKKNIGIEKEKEKI